MIEYLDADLVLEIHDSEARPSSVDRNALESAVQSPRAGFGDFEAYPTLLEKAAVLLSHLANNHAFGDGNKRCAWVSCRVFLGVNGVEIKASTHEIIEFVESRVVAHDAAIYEIVAWLNDHQA